MERKEKSYLNPPPLTPAEIPQIYGPNPGAEARERELARAAMRSIRKRRPRRNLADYLGLFAGIL